MESDHGDWVYEQYDLHHETIHHLVEEKDVLQLENQYLQIEANSLQQILQGQDKAFCEYFVKKSGCWWMHWPWELYWVCLNSPAGSCRASNFIDYDEEFDSGEYDDLEYVNRTDEAEL